MVRSMVRNISKVLHHFPLLTEMRGFKLLPQMFQAHGTIQSQRIDMHILYCICI